MINNLQNQQLKTLFGEKSKQKRETYSSI